MPALVCTPPNVIDHTFPRDVQELRLVGTALAKIVELLQQGGCALVLTRAMRTFILSLEYEFNWTRMAEYPQLQVIYSIITQFGLQQTDVYTIDVSGVSGHQPHPVPLNCTSPELGLIWSEELGRLFVMHSRCCSPGKFFIGVACPRAFAGECKDAYNNPGHLPSFPLVGPDDLSGLEDFFTWDLPDDLHQRNVTFNDACTRIWVIGGDVKPPSGSSHYEVKFKDGRTWPLDRNYREIPEPFLKELVSITGFPLLVVKYALLFGELPPRKPRIPG